MDLDCSTDDAQLVSKLRAAILAHAGEEAWRERGRWLQVRVLIGVGQVSLLLNFEQGLIREHGQLPPLTAWDFAIRGSGQAWAQFWRHPPPPGWHDLLALSKRGEMRLEGNLQPFMANLQYFKDLLALPRSAA